MTARGPVVAFDLGGVLVDVDKDHLRSFGPRDVVDRAFHGPHHDAATVGDLDEHDFAVAIAASLARDGVMIGVEHARDAWARVVSWRPGAAALLGACASRVTTHVWSNTDPIHWRVLGAAIDGVVAHAATSFRVRAAKPAAAFYVRALSGLDPERVLFFDDRADNVAAARAMGIDAVVCASVDDARARLRARGVDVG